MTTLTIMKARIATEVRRSNITSQIADAISTAIGALESERFFFNESREITFSTVASQEFYDSDDAANLGRIIKLDYVKALIGDALYDLRPMTPTEIEGLNNASGSEEGQPLGYCWYQEQLRLYPIPAAVYTIRIGAVIKVAAPATDGEANNPWMVKAERVVRCRAKYELYAHVLLDLDKAALFHPENDGGPTGEALLQLRARTANLTNIGGYQMIPTRF